ncbi:MAG: hypothetical protein J6Q67_04445 [Clostridia bacterium]|nr:hypothetical protein [Clostridia bacterium]
MKIFEITVSKQKIKTRAPCRLVAGTVGLYGVKVTYDDDWDKAPYKHILFDGCEAIKVEDKGEVIPIPHESIKEPCRLKISLLGMDGNGEIRIPTYNSDDNGIYVFPNDWKDEGVGDPEKPTPNIWEQLKKEIEEVKESVNAKKTSVLLVDAETSATYKVQVVGGKLTMEEVVE